ELDAEHARPRTVGQDRLDDADLSAFDVHFQYVDPIVSEFAGQRRHGVHFPEEERVGALKVQRRVGNVGRVARGVEGQLGFLIPPTDREEGERVGEVERSHVSDGSWCGIERDDSQPVVEKSQVEGSVFTYASAISDGPRHERVSWNPPPAIPTAESDEV